MDLNLINLQCIPEYAAMLEPERNGVDAGASVLDPTLRFPRALKEFRYLYLNYAVTSPFYGDSEGGRKSAALKASGLTLKDLKDKTFLKAEAMTRALQQKTVEMRALEATRSLVEKFIQMVTAIDPNERDEKNKYILNPKDTTATMTSVPTILQNLKHVEQEVIKVMGQSTGYRGGKVPGRLDKRHANGKTKAE